MHTLSDFGWKKQNQQQWNELGLFNALPGRIVADYGTSLKIAMPEVITAELSGKLAHYTDRENTPKVGDWVVANVHSNGTATIESVVMRNKEIARKAAGNRTVKQIIATNVDVAFVLLALDNDFSIQRLKRFIYQLSINAIEPVVVLNKADKTNDIQSYLDQLQPFDIPKIVSIAKEGVGVDEIRNLIQPGRTAILLGSSGVGKSTLTNKLLGREAQAIREVRQSDSTGMHTTVHRELFVLPNGGLLIDTPGVREFQLWGTEEELDANYQDVVGFAQRCKYTTCDHGEEEGCAIRDALRSGGLEASQYANYVAMKSEVIELAKKTTGKMRRSNGRPRGKASGRSTIIDYEDS